MQNDGQDAASARTSRSIGEVDQSFYLIGVGASAGGLDAIKQLISQIPTGFPHSFVIIQHLSPDYKSLMSDILGRETIMPVSEVADHMPIESGHIYLIPPKSNVVIQGTEDDISLAAEEGVVAPVNGLRFSLVDPSPRPQLNLPIDLFFHSLAEAVAERSIAIVLSGTGSDGSRGLRGIKDRDGFVLVQDPETAAFDGMPRAAIGTKIVDLVCSPDAMIGELQRYLQMREGGVVSVDTLFEGAESEFADLLKLISETADIDFSQYKEPTLKRRIARRMVLRKCDTVSEYLKIARADPSEVSVIYREFLVGVTNFFRDLPSWRDLEAEYLPRIFANAKKGETVKVWSVGCSTGEEAYTIAFLIEAYRRRNEIETEFRVFASDVNASAIAIAKEGVYPNSTLDEIPNEFREQNFFTFHGESFHISQSIRSRVIFSSHNVLENAPYVRTDLIVCRNLMIYLSPEMQKKVLSVFSFSLRKNGFLFLGAAENIGRNSAGFDAMRGPGRIFQNVRKAPVDLPNTRSGAHLPLLHAGLTPMPRARRIATREIQRQNSETTSFLPKLLMQLNTAVFILNENGHIVETFGDYRRYLSMPEDAFSSNLVELVTGRLRSTISLLFRRASTEGAGEKRSIRLLEDPDSNYVDVYSQKIEWESYPTAYLFMIQVSQPPTVAVGDGNGADRAAVQPALIGQLESEIEALQEMLSVTAEDLGVSNEELQTTNEELTASNEELQANNEEMQSINEELHTVNAENADKIHQLEDAQADIENLLTGADLAVILLDSQLCIRRFNLAFRKYIELSPDDYGRPLANFSANLVENTLNTLLEDAEQACQMGEEFTRQVKTKDGDFAVARVRPFKDGDDEIDGVVITFIDTTQLNLLQQEVLRQRDRLEGLLESEAAGYFDWHIQDNYEYMSPRFKSMFGYADDEMENSPDAWQKIIHPEDLEVALSNFDKHVKSKGIIPYDQEVRYIHKNGSIIWVICRGRVVEWSPEGAPLRMMGAHVDITALKNRETAVRQRADEIERFAFVAAHDLLEPMNTIESSLSILVDDLGGGLELETQTLVDFLGVSVTRMKARIRGILDYARLQDERPEFSIVDLNLILSECLDDLREKVTESGAKINSKKLPKVKASSGMISRVFQNLLTNALKYRNADSDCIVTVSSKKGPNGRVIITVEDNGIGVPEEYREDIFKLFSRLHTEDDYEGIGLGLALTERMIRTHGGEISVSEGKGGGSAFTFTLEGA